MLVLLGVEAGILHKPVIGILHTLCQINAVSPPKGMNPGRVG
jgi:hypothetical protein